MHEREDDRKGRGEEGVEVEVEIKEAKHEAIGETVHAY